MIRDNELEPRVYESEHIQRVLAQIETTFPDYLASFLQRQPRDVFTSYINGWDREKEAYRTYFDQEVLEEFECDAAAFKGDMARNCPIVRRCLKSPSEVMDDYRRSFQLTTGRRLLDTVRSISKFAHPYVASFDNREHESACKPSDLGLEPLNDSDLGCSGVIGYGVQSCLLYGAYPHEFAYRSQNAIWALYFLSERQDFGLSDGSEFLMIYPDRGTCEQNYFYPAELFAFYALKTFLLLKSVCEEQLIKLHDSYRYTYLSSFFDHVAEVHRPDIAVLRQSSEQVEAQPWGR